MTETFKIEKRSYRRKIVGLNPASDVTFSSGVMISLPRLNFLEKDGPYLPEWAVEYKEAPAPVNEDVEPKPFKYKKSVYSRRNIINNGVAVTPFEDKVYKLYQEGKTAEDICKLLETNASTVNGAYNRYKKKMGLYEVDDEAES